MAVNLIIGIGALALLFFFFTSQQKSISGAISGLSKFGQDTHNTVFPEPKEQQARNEKGAIGNTQDFLFGEGQNKIIQDSGVIPTIYGGLFGAGSFEETYGQPSKTKDSTVKVNNSKPAYRPVVSNLSTQKRQTRRGSVFG